MFNKDCLQCFPGPPGRPKEPLRGKHSHKSSQQIEHFRKIANEPSSGAETKSKLNPQGFFKMPCRSKTARGPQEAPRCPNLVPKTASGPLKRRPRWLKSHQKAAQEPYRRQPTGALEPWGAQEPPESRPRATKEPPRLPPDLDLGPSVLDFRTYRGV